MKQQTLAMAADQNAQYEQYRKPTRRDVFLATMEQIVPWAALCAVIEPHYPKAGNGRPPVGLERMLRMYFVQHWFNLADAACEEALYDSTALRRFVGIDLGRERVPDATTLLKFRRLLEKHKLGEELFAKVGQVLQASGHEGRAPARSWTPRSSAHRVRPRTQTRQRDPEMHQTRKGEQWYFGMKLHIGVDSQSGLVHSAVVTAANVHDKHPLPDLLHGNERRVYGDSAYARQKELIRVEGAERVGLHQPARAQGQRDEELERMVNRNKSQSARARRTCLRGRQAAVGLRQGALPRTGQERHAGVRGAGAGQHLSGRGVLYAQPRP